MRAVVSAELSPQSYARIGGMLYLLIMAAGLFAQAFVRDRLVVPGDAVATASNIRSHASVGFAVALIFFGWSCVALGYLTFTSGFFPKALGVLMAIAGACYLTNSAALPLSPRLASILFPSLLVPAFIVELCFAVWLTVKGVNVARWQERAAGRSASS